MRKKIFDFVGASLLLLATAPFMVLIALWISTTSYGPAVFRQVRIGRKGELFTILKFRTMRHGSGREGETVLPGDERITRAGRFLRKTHLDELPQLINVLRGEMSLVGPRPLTQETVQRMFAESPATLERLAMLPGMTGLTQVRGRMWRLRRGASGVLRLDLFYMRHQCLWLDLCILVRTAETVLHARGI